MKQGFTGLLSAGKTYKAGLHGIIVRLQNL